MGRRCAGALRGCGVLLTVFALWATASGAAASTAGASTLWARSVAAARAAGSVHYVEVTTAQGTTITIVGDVNRVEGSQQIVLHSANHPDSTADNGTVTVSLVDGTAYVKGDVGGLHWAIGLPTADGPAVAGKWISIPPSAPDGLFANTAAELTTGSVIENFMMKGPLSLGRHGHVGNSAVVAVHGYLKGTGRTVVHQTFEVRSAGAPLPLSSTSPPVGTHYGRNVATYSKWGEPVSVTAPVGATPISSLMQQTTTTAPQVVTAAATSISTAPPRGSDATPTADRV